MILSQLYKGLLLAAVARCMATVASETNYKLRSQDMLLTRRLGTNGLDGSGVLR